MSPLKNAAAERASAAPNVVELNNVSKRFVLRRDNSLKERFTNFGRGARHREDFWALRDLDLNLAAGTTLGLIGHNGSGKSTLLKIIGGILEPTTGVVRRRGRVAALLELGAGFHPDLTGRENVFLNAAILGLSRTETEARLPEIIDFSGIEEFIDTQVKFYSSGMYVRLAFAVAVHTDPDIVLVDEVLAVGDEAFQRKCLAKIREFQQEGRTIVLVSHGLGQIIEMCDRTVVLSHGRVAFDGPPREAVSIFRDILEGRRSDIVQTTLAPTVVGTIHRVAVTGSGSSSVGVVAAGADVVVDVDMFYSGVVDNWELEIHIDNEWGHRVYSASTVTSGVRLAPLDGEHGARAVVVRPPFGAGKYLVSAFVLDGTGRHMMDAVHAGGFEIVPQSDDQSSGMLRADVAFSDR